MISIKQDLWVPAKGRWIIAIVGFGITAPKIWRIILLQLTLSDLAVIILMISLIVLVFTIRKELIIYTKRGRVFEGFRLLGREIGKWEEYNEIEKIFINRIKYRDKGFQYFFPSTPGVIMSDFSYSQFVYKAFIKFDTGIKMELLVDTDKEKLLQQLNKYNDVLQTHIMDNTGE